MITTALRRGRFLPIFCAAAAACLAGTVHAGTITYPNLAGSGFTITNISESNDLAGNVALYGQPTLTNGGTGIVFDASMHPLHRQCR
jgi:hypothetical protein